MTVFFFFFLRNWVFVNFVMMLYGSTVSHIIVLFLLQLISTTFISHWPMNNLIVDWIGPVTDRDCVLEKAVRSFGIGQTYEVILKRLKKSLKEPITTWNVHKVLVCIYM